MKEYREYEFDHEKLKQEHFSKSHNCIILAKYKELIEKKESEKDELKEKVIFKREIAFFNDLDHTKYF